MALANETGSPKPRARPFPKGNSGRPKGARNKKTVTLEGMLEGDVGAMVARMKERALQDDMSALRFCLGRIFPASKDRSVTFELRKIEGPEDAQAAIADLLDAATTGKITPSEARIFAELIELSIKA